MSTSVRLLKATPFTSDKIAPNEGVPEFYSKELGRDIGPPSALYSLPAAPAYPKTTGIRGLQPFTLDPSNASSTGLFASTPIGQGPGDTTAAAFVLSAQPAKLNVAIYRNRDRDHKPYDTLSKSVVGEPSTYNNLNDPSQKDRHSSELQQHPDDANKGQLHKAAEKLVGISNAPQDVSAYPEKSMMMQFLRMDEFTTTADPSKRPRRRSDDAMIARRYPVSWAYFMPSNIKHLLSTCKWVPGKTPVITDIRRLLEQTQRSYSKQFEKYASTGRSEPFPVDTWLAHMNNTTLDAIEQLAAAKMKGLKFIENVNDRPITSNRPNQHDIIYDKTVRTTGHRVQGPRDQYSQRGQMQKLGVYLQTQEGARADHTKVLSQQGYITARAASTTSGSPAYQSVQQTAVHGPRPVLRRNAGVNVQQMLPRLHQTKTTMVFSDTGRPGGSRDAPPQATPTAPSLLLQQGLRPQVSTRMEPQFGAYGRNISRQQLRERIQTSMM